MAGFSNISDGELNAMYQASMGGIKYTNYKDEDGNDEREINLAQFGKGNVSSPDRHSLARGWAKYDLFGNDHTQVSEDRVNLGFAAVRNEYNERQNAKAKADAAKTKSLEDRLKALEGQKKKTEKKEPGDMQIELSSEIKGAQDTVSDYESGKGIESGKPQSGATALPGSGASSAWEQTQQIANQSSFGLQNNTDFTSQYNPSGESDTDTHNKFDGSQFATAGKSLNSLKQGAQSFADKYKLDLIGSGKTKDEDKKFAFQQ